MAGMLERVTSGEFTRSTTSGRTKPAILVCTRADDTTLEVIAKFSASCDEGVTNLAREVIAACLAGDLGLPIPVPVLIEIPNDWTESVADAAQRKQIAASSQIAFGSTLVGSQFTSWNRGTIPRSAAKQPELSRTRRRVPDF
jgi:hypothetical protein